MFPYPVDFALTGPEILVESIRELCRVRHFGLSEKCWFILRNVTRRLMR